MKLEQWLDKHEVSPREFAARIGLKEATSIYRYLPGRRTGTPPTRRPDPQIIAAIARETGGDVGFDDFYPPQSKEGMTAA